MRGRMCKWVCVRVGARASGHTWVRGHMGERAHVREWVQESHGCEMAESKRARVQVCMWARGHVGESVRVRVGTRGWSSHRRGGGGASESADNSMHGDGTYLVPSDGHCHCCRVV